MKKCLVRSAHDVSDGGLFINLVESSITNKLGFDITSDAEVRADAFLFGEAQGRIVVSVTPRKEDAFIDYMIAQKHPFSALGHVTKGGILAGPKVLEHIVDTVLYLEGEQYNIYRILRSTKNRFGSTNELGIFKMEEKGLMEVLNPSELLLSEKPSHVSGSVVAATFEGSRPLLVEMQALVSYSNLGMPRRMTTGVDYNRVLLILAVLEKRVGYSLHSRDVPVNIAGVIEILEPALDLAIIMAIASSFKDVPIDPATVIFGEVGLAGEVRMVNQVEKRIQEVYKLGFKRCIIPKSNLKSLSNFSSKKGLEIIGVKTVQEAINLVLN